MRTNCTPCERILRNVLLANATFSALSGAVFVGYAAAFGRLIGLSDPLILTGVGLALMLFAGSVYWASRRPGEKRGWIWGIVAADFGWVVATIVLLIAAPTVLNSLGHLISAAVAAIVLGFALVQSVGLLKTRSRVPLAASLATEDRGPLRN